MSIDSTVLVPVARRLISQRTCDLTRGMPANERSAFVDEQAQGLAEALAEAADDHIADVRSDLRGAAA